MTIIYFIIALGLLVFIHEFGHFLAAKRQKIGVEKFSLGFGPKLFGFKKGETTYLISALPMGGYVKLKGEDPAEADAQDPASYSTRPPSHRFGVVFAGPLMNLLLALVLMPLVFWIGRLEPAWLTEPPVVVGIKAGSAASRAGLRVGDRILSIGTRSVSDWEELLNEVLLRPNMEMDLSVERAGRKFSRKVLLEEEQNLRHGLIGIEPNLFIGNEPVIDEVAHGGPAEQAGVRAGDQVLSINGVRVDDWSEMSERVDASQGKPLTIDLRQETTGAASQPIRRVTVVPRFDDGLKRWLIGVQKDFEKRVPFVKRQYPFLQSLQMGMKENWRLAGMTLTVLKRLVTLELSYKTLGGPIRIAQASAHAARSGITPFLYFLCFMSLQLGLLNLLPIPVLDGGHLFFIVVEKLIRKPLPVRIRLAAEQAGFILLITLMILVTLHDVESVWGFRELFEKVRELF